MFVETQEKLEMSDDMAKRTFDFSVEGLDTALEVARFEVDEAISELFRVRVTLTSVAPELSLDDLVGRAAVLRIHTGDDAETRYFHGMVARVEETGLTPAQALYTALLVPKAFLLGQRQDTRFFQDLSTPQIVAEILRSSGITDVALSITEPHETRAYCVQYRESDWAFVSRLLEEEGIHYFFEHHEDRHVLRISDQPTSHPAIPAQSTLRHIPDRGALRGGEAVHELNYAQEIRPGKVTLSDFNFEHPSLPLLRSSGEEEIEVYDPPGDYLAPTAGDARTSIRVQEHLAGKRVGRGSSNCARLVPGHVFTLEDHPREANNGGHLVVRVHHEGIEPGRMTSADGPTSYRQRFEVIPERVPFRPARVTPRPSPRGVQTAIVVGPDGEEIHTDKHGRVQVRFHWDREHKSSCWIRVSQAMAGAGFGAMVLPRVGHEVIVDFLEGNPDRPIIVGHVYHGTNVPPYPLPAEKTKSTFKSRSTPGGDGFNELRLEDQKGHEEIFIRAEKDMRVEILHDRSERVGHDRVSEVEHDERILVHHDREVRIEHSQSQEIKGSDKLVVLESRSETIGGAESVQIAGIASRAVGMAQLETIGGYRRVRVKANHDETIGGNMSLTVGHDRKDSIGGESKEIVQGAKTLAVHGDYGVSAHQKMTVVVKGDASETIEGTKHLEAGKSVTVKCGKVTISIDRDGKVAISGAEIEVKTTGDVRVSAKDVKIKSSGSVDLAAAGNVKIKGGSVDLC
jgi:type VI secretion system secreted protein VgrG